MGETMITAHSGADGTKENSLEFVAYAMQTGADALEVDVRMGENGILFCPTIRQMKMRYVLLMYSV